jgi:hypothetical protein
VEENFIVLEEMGVDAHVALGRGEKGERDTKAGPANERMHPRRRSKHGRKVYERRKVIVEPPFGWIQSGLLLFLDAGPGETSRVNGKRIP